MIIWWGWLLCHHYLPDNASCATSGLDIDLPIMVQYIWYGNMYMVRCDLAWFGVLWRINLWHFKVLHALVVNFMVTWCSVIWWCEKKLGLDVIFGCSANLHQETWKPPESFVRSQHEEPIHILHQHAVCYGIAHGTQKLPTILFLLLCGYSWHMSHTKKEVWKYGIALRMTWVLYTIVLQLSSALTSLTVPQLFLYFNLIGAKNILTISWSGSIEYFDESMK